MQMDARSFFKSVVLARCLPVTWMDGSVHFRRWLASLLRARARSRIRDTKQGSSSRRNNITSSSSSEEYRILIVVAVVAITPPANYLLSSAHPLSRAKTGSSQDSQDLKDFARSAGHVTFADIDKRDPTLGYVFASSFPLPFLHILCAPC